MFSDIVERYLIGEPVILEPYLTSNGMITPVRKDHDLVLEIEAARTDRHPDLLDLWWLGQSGFLVVWNGHTILFDPYLSDSLTEKYSGTNKPHVRMSERVVDPELLTRIDVITSSHNHTDHLDAETLKPILKNCPHTHLVIPEANRKFIADRVGCEIGFPKGLSDGTSVSIGDLTFTGVAAAHNEIERDGDGNCKFLGYMVRFGDWTIYHSGDTLYHDGLVTSLAPHQPDVVFVPINGSDPARRVAGNMNGSEAARLANQVKARLAIPHHFHLFEFNTAEPALFEASCMALDQDHVTMKLGERLQLDRREERQINLRNK